MPTARNYRTVPGSERFAGPEYQLVGNVDPKDVLTITIRLRRLSSKGELRTEAMDLSRRALRARNYLSRREFTAKHGAAQKDMDLRSSRQVEQNAQ
jgi:hypothetical protein